MRFSASAVGARPGKRGVTRRDFLKFCGAVAVAMGMGPGFAGQVANALTSSKRPSLVYLHGAECTGCSESLLRACDPFIDDIIFDVLSLDYHETLMAAAGEAAEEALHKAVHAPEGFICVVEGAVPTALGGSFGTIGGRTILEMFTEILPKARHVVSYGTCACFGGIQSAAPNPTGSLGVNAAFSNLGVKAVNVAGCPPNPLNLVGTLVHLIQNDAPPPADHLNRPRMFFQHTVHEKCPRLEFFARQQFATSFDSEEARKGWCLYKLGCKGPLTYNNCPSLKFNQTNWPVEAGHPCIGCSEPEFWDNFTPFYSS